MWVLPSRSRPQNIIRFIESYKSTNATTPVYLIFDDDDPQPDYDIPANWIVSTGKRRLLSEMYNDFFAEYPDLQWYGFIADDVVPLTMEWDKLLIESAGEWNMSVPLESDTTGKAPHFVLGGELVRSVGFLCLHGLDRICIDTVWINIAEKRSVYCYLPEVVLEHRHFSNKKALLDKTYKKFNKDRDKTIYETWRKTNDY